MRKGMSLIVCCFILSGCATMQRSSNPDIQGMQSRIDFLEEELKTRDQEILSMQDEISRVKQENVMKYDNSEITVKKELSVNKVKKDELKEIIRASGVTAVQVQQALKKAGFYHGTLDGKIGSKTKEAIKEFQRENNLTVDGIVGKGTWAKLKENI